MRYATYGFWIFLFLFLSFWLKATIFLLLVSGVFKILFLFWQKASLRLKVLEPAPGHIAGKHWVALNPELRWWWSLDALGANESQGLET